MYFLAESHYSVENPVQQTFEDLNTKHDVNNQTNDANVVEPQSLLNRNTNPTKPDIPTFGDTIICYSVVSGMKSVVNSFFHTFIFKIVII